MNLASLAKHKNSIIAVIVLVIVCGGTFLGVKALNSGVDAPVVSSTTITTAPSTTVPTTMPTTAPTTTMPTTTAPTNTITTFPIDQSTTAPTTTMPTTAPTTQPTTQFTLPTTQPTQGAQSGSNGLGGILDKLTGGDKNPAIFDDGVASYQYAPNGNYYYTNEDPWQRAFGYNELYDNAAQFTAIYLDTMRCKFEYNNMDWMIQFWKGQYGYVFVGTEVGVYNKPKNRTAEHYDAVSDEEALYMTMTGYRDGVEMFTRDYGKYWWCTGFVPGKLDKFSDRSELSMKARITMKDYKMLLGFTSALKANGLILGEDYSTSGLDVTVEW